MFEGDVKIWAENIKLVSGRYQMNLRDKKILKQIRVINCEDITQNSEIIRNFNNY